MNLAEIKKLIEIFNHSDIMRLNLKQDDFEIKLDKQSSCVQTPASIQSHVSLANHQPVHIGTTTPNAAPSNATTNSESEEFITSPMVGTFYRCPSPDSAPYVNVGDTIKKGQTIGIIEAMKIMNEIEAECDCKVISLEVNDAQPVEFGTKLVKVEKI
ncbi:acetyl-CoA carboxylase biotin carboxyl carrier protein [Helicobacter sp. 11S03491-1]|uniref:acetyl-CoA carboxylase biotin carboxyl carrier protein n=1 Tax=Helicobacter sp. 11S03491-1 TaxID=1476196 RepID=UPI000BA6DFA5|nr:acetyl-CoA carboxylase biotin carboxyl carrier protein [Helicobacter sp. 11S03491-1]PAF43302.1 acetyl-CoA carboxylase, biotin carboxyl carrier protein [Helicobacter sp. 11S03491-1]